MIPPHIAAARRRYRITDAQERYLRRLLHEAFANRYPTPGWDPNHLDRCPRESASKKIDELVSAKKNGWKRLEFCGPSRHG